MSKSLLTNILCVLVIIIGYIIPQYGEYIKMTGFFALSGGVTNWLAIHMLFEKVPFIYGSGVIPSRFEEFKAGIKKIIFEEFFTKNHIEEIMEKEFSNSIDSSKVIDKIDFDNIFEELVNAIANSSLGPMLNMVGGIEALQPIKEPVIEKFKTIIPQIMCNIIGDKDSKNKSDELLLKIEKIVDSRLEQLTAQMVKIIIQGMIHKHLGWLVVWGGVFGGLIGFIFNFI